MSYGNTGRRKKYQDGGCSLLGKVSDYSHHNIGRREKAAGRRHSSREGAEAQRKSLDRIYMINRIHLNMEAERVEIGYDKSD